jgi:phosphohistidine swiveling domain-containing protein
METLHFWTTGEDLTHMIRDFFYEGNYAKAEAILIDGGLPESIIRLFFMNGYKLEGDSRDGSLSLVKDIPYTEDEFHEVIRTGVQTLMSSSKIEELPVIEREWGYDEDRNCYTHIKIETSKTYKPTISNYFTGDYINEDFEVLHKYFPFHMIKNIIQERVINENGYAVIPKIKDSMFSGVILNDGTIVECEAAGHRDLLPVLRRLGLVRYEHDPAGKANHLKVTCGQLYEDVAYSLIRDFEDDDYFTGSQAQLDVLMANIEHISFGGSSKRVMKSIIEYTVTTEAHGGKWDMLRFIQKYFPHIKTVQISKEPIEGVKNCIRTSPKYSIAGVLTSIFDVQPDSVDKMKAEWEEKKNLVGRPDRWDSDKFHYDNELFWFYQKFEEGVNGVAHYIHDEFTYKCSENQGDIVQGKEGTVRLPKEHEDYLREFMKFIADNSRYKVQVEFVFNGDEVIIAQLRLLQESNVYSCSYIDEDRVIAEGKSFYQGTTDTLTVDDVLIVDRDSDSLDLIGKKALIVREDVEFSHLLAMSQNQKIPSIYGMKSDFELPEKFVLNTMNKKRGLILNNYEST